MIIRRHNNHDIPELNTTSTADISFMLLIFFLVTSSMGTDKGVQHQLPIMPQEEEQQAPASVNKNLLMTIRIDSVDNVLVDDKKVTLEELRASVSQFVYSRGRKHLLMLDADSEASYDTYFHVQNQVVKAYAQVRARMAHEQLHKSYSDCTAAEREKLQNLCPQHISETYNTAMRVQEKGGEER